MINVLLNVYLCKLVNTVDTGVCAELVQLRVSVSQNVVIIFY